MPDHHTLFGEALAAWNTTRGLLIREIENIPEERLGFRASPQSRSVAELVVHIIDSGRTFAGEIVRPDADLTRAPAHELYMEYSANVPASAGKAVLVDTLRTTLQESDAWLREAGPDFLLQPITGIFGTPVTRFAMLHFAIEHESYHRGQVAAAARQLGLVPALTQMLEGMKT